MASLLIGISGAVAITWIQSERILQQLKRIYKIK